MQNKQTKLIFSGLAVALVIVLAGLLVVGTFFVKQVSENTLAVAAAKVLQLPIASVNGTSVYYHDFLSDKKSLSRFYKQIPDMAAPNDEELSRQVLSRILANVVVEQIADEFDVELSDDAIEQRKDELFASFYSEKEAAEDVKKKYGWSMKQYTNRVIKPLELETQLRDTFNEKGSEEYETTEEIRASHILIRNEGVEDAEAKKVAQSVYDALIGGESFESLALQYGSDATSSVGGDLGWFAKGVMVPEFEEAVFSLEKGEVYEGPLETAFGFHIIQKTDERQVRDFDAFLATKIEEANIEIKVKLANPFE